MARVHPGLVGQPAEQLVGHVAVERGEVLGVGGPPDPAGEQAVAGEDVRPALGVVVDQRDAARRVPHQVHHRQLDRTEPQHVAVLEEHLGLHRDLGRVQRVREGTRPRRGHHFGQPLPVVTVPVRGDHADQPVRPDQVEQAAGVVGGVDEDLLPAGPAAQQVRVVVHRPDRELRDHQPGQLPHVGVAARLYLAGVVHLGSSNAGWLDGWMDGWAAGQMTASDPRWW